MILFLAHCRSAPWFVLLQNYSNCSTCFSGPTLWGKRRWSWTAQVRCSSLKFMQEEHAEVVCSLQKTYFTIKWNVTVGGKPLWGVGMALSEEVWQFQHQRENIGYSYSVLCGGNDLNNLLGAPISIHTTTTFAATQTSIYHTNIVLSLVGQEMQDCDGNLLWPWAKQLTSKCILCQDWAKIRAEQRLKKLGSILGYSLQLKGNFAECKVWE